MNKAPIKEFEPRSRSHIKDLRIKVIPKKLWIEQVIHALTVAKFLTIHALTVAHLRINGRITINSLYLPILKKPLVGATLFGDNLAGCRPSRLHLLPTAVLKNSIKPKLPLILLLIGLAGCEQQSEIDKCVEGQVISTCLGKEDCIKQVKPIMEGESRLKCLEAQSGKKE
jgi:hypothetical protein